MTQQQMDRILEIGIALTSERDTRRLLDMILSEAMSLTNSDAGTLYLLDDDRLRFTIVKNNTLGTDKGTDGAVIDIEPVPLNKEHLAALAILENRTILIDDAYDPGLSYALQGPRRYDALTGYHTGSVLVTPMNNAKGEPVGVLQLINAEDADGKVIPFPGDAVKAVESVASQAAVAIQNARYTQEIKDLFASYVETSVQAIGKLTPFNENHTRNMVEYAGRFLDWINIRAEAEGRELPYPPVRREELLMSCWLHDLGKLVTPVDIMNKNTRLWPNQKADIMHRLERFRLTAEVMKLRDLISDDEERDVRDRTTELRDFIETADTKILQNRAEALEKYAAWRFTGMDGTDEPYLTDEEIHQLEVPYRTLTDEEFEVMHDHARQTGELLAQMRFPDEMKNVRTWAPMHHELLNGRGYPDGLTADVIPEEVRIITILDIFEALTACDRDYKTPKTPEEAVSHLRKIAGFGEIDADLVELFAESRCWEG